MDYIRLHRLPKGVFFAISRDRSGALRHVRRIRSRYVFLYLGTNFTTSQSMSALRSLSAAQSQSSLLS